MAKNDPGKPVPLARVGLVLSPPEPEQLLPVPLAEWRQIMRRLEDHPDHSAWYQALALFLFGLGVSGLLAALSFPLATDFSRQVPTGEELRWGVLLLEFLYICVAWGGIYGGYITLAWSRTEHELKGKMRSWIVEDMQRFEERHVPPAPGRTAARAEPPL